MARNKSIANEFENLPSLQRFLLELPDDIDRIVRKYIYRCKTNIQLYPSSASIISIFNYKKYTELSTSAIGSSWPLC